MSPALKRPLAPAPSLDSPGTGTTPGRAENRSNPDNRPHSITDPVTGKKKRVSLSCAQCKCRSRCMLIPGAKRKQKVCSCSGVLRFRELGFKWHQLTV